MFGLRVHAFAGIPRHHDILDFYSTSRYLLRSDLLLRLTKANPSADLLNISFPVSQTVSHTQHPSSKIAGIRIQTYMYMIISHEWLLKQCLTALHLCSRPDPENDV